MAQKNFHVSKGSMLLVVPNSGGCLATDRIMVDGCEIGYMYRENSNRPDDTGWSFFSGDEDDDYANNPDNIGVYLVNTVANCDPDILPYLTELPPCAFEKIVGTNTYKRVEFQS